MGFVDRLFGGEGETRINLSRDLSRDNLQDLLAELNQESVECSINLFINGFALYLLLVSCAWQRSVFDLRVLCHIRGQAPSA